MLAKHVTSLLTSSGREYQQTVTWCVARPTVGTNVLKIWPTMGRAPLSGLIKWT